MNKYACYADTDWKFDIEAPDEREALARGQACDPTVTRVELVSRTGGQRGLG